MPGLKVRLTGGSPRIEKVEKTFFFLFAVGNLIYMVAESFYSLKADINKCLIFVSYKG